LRGLLEFSGCWIELILCGGEEIDLG
jgi:hypothetical protein